jgi:hypothetical protein
VKEALKKEVEIKKFKKLCFGRVMLCDRPKPQNSEFWGLLGLKNWANAPKLTKIMLNANFETWCDLMLFFILDYKKENRT